MSELLRRVGFTVHHIFDIYPNRQHENVGDPEWIKLCGENGWIAVSGDKRLESTPANRQAVIDAKAKIFVLTDSGSKPEIWGAAIIVGHYRMAEIIDGNDGPFYVSVGKRSDGHIARPKLPSGYDPPSAENPPTPTDGAPVVKDKINSGATWHWREGGRRSWNDERSTHGFKHRRFYERRGPL